MLHNIRLAAELAAPRNEIYSMYVDAKKHATVTGAPARIAPRASAAFSAFDSTLTGRILHVVPGELIVQTWRSSNFKPSDADSILILTLLPQGRGNTLLDLQHLNVPEHDYAGISQGWELYYFAPWREYLAKRSGKRASKPAKMG